VALRGALTFTLASFAAQAISLARTILLARLLSPYDFGIAATYLLIVNLIDMLSQMGLERVIVQDRDGNNPALQGSVQALQALRGMIGALALLAIAWPFALFFDQPDMLGSYLPIALVPLLGAFLHFDQHRFRRDMNFLPASLMLFIPYAVSLAIMVGLSFIIRDHRIMLWAVIGQQAVALILSHWLARRPYRWHWEPMRIRHIVSFGWPLFLNGILLFAIMNGERMIVGNALGMTELAVFTLMLNLSMTPTLVLASVAQSLFLPQLSRVQDDRQAFEPLAHATMQASLAMALGVAVAAATIGPALVDLLVGEAYRAGLALFVWLALSQAFRIAKAGCGVVALAKGFSGNQLAGNLVRIAVLPLGWWWLVQGGSMVGLAWFAIAAEAVGFIIALRLAVRDAAIPARPVIVPALLCTLAFLLIGADLLARPVVPALGAWLDWTQLSFVVVALLALATMTDLRRHLLRAARGA
jgi:O-antigen/teichoic acid export membrane protein